jgi:hypothetical protein
MKDDAHETYIRAKQKAQHQVKIVLAQLNTNYRFRQRKALSNMVPAPGPVYVSAEDPKYLNEMLRGRNHKISTRVDLFRVGHMCREKKDEYAR